MDPRLAAHLPDVGAPMTHGFQYSLLVHFEPLSLCCGELWTRGTGADFLPAPGDRVTLWEHPDDADGEGEQWTVKSRYWGLRGSIAPVTVVLTEMQVDPRDPDGLWKTWGRAPWRSTSDWPDVREALRGAGWRRD